MRIVYVSVEGRMAGAEQSLLLLLRHLRTHVEATVACPAGSALREHCADEKIACREFPSIESTKALSKRQCLRVALCLRRVAGRIKPDIIHANNFHAMAIASFSRRGDGSKLVWHARDLPKPKLLTKWCIRRANAIIAVSHSIKRALMNLGARAETIDVVHNGIDPLVPPPSSGAGRNGHFTFACVGQIVGWKNQEAFLLAAEAVHRQLPETRFLLVGANVFGRRDSYETQLKTMIESRRMSYVQCIGWQKDMGPIWRNTDCLVHTAYMEPFGRVLIEAMAHGRPVVAFASGGPTEIVADGRTGLLVSFGDVQALANAMLQMAKDPHLVAAMGQAARQRVGEQFRADTTAEGVMAVYIKVLGR